jgi:hypothetical protein
MFTKYVIGTKKISSLDYSFGYFFVEKSIELIASLVYFQNYKIDWQLYVIGSIGSVFDCLGCLFVNCAISTGNPIGPILALVNTEVLMVTVIAAIRLGRLPNYMQLCGFGIGTLGVGVLTRLFKSK